MERVSISNYVLSISYAQFCSAVDEFEKLVADAFGCECELTVKAMQAVKDSPTHLPDRETMRYIADMNARNVFATASKASALSAEAFARAKYVEVLIRPRVAEEGPRYAFAHLECKGTRRRMITYYVQPVGKKVVKALRRNHLGKLIGDGYKHNTD
ncbi:MAG TPA: hypothetical protein V6C76_01445 [Drouetiella sp.]